MREGISFAVRSGSAAGRFSAAAARTGDNEGALAGYRRWVEAALAPEMAAGRERCSPRSSPARRSSTR